MSEADAFQVRLEVYEGPLDLLLSLVRREELEITAVALARVTGQFLDYLERLPGFDGARVAAFCEVAATLMMLKSRALLPRPPARDDAEEPDAGDLLLERLRAYRQLQQAAKSLQAREQSGLRAFVRQAPPPDIPPRLDPGEVSPDDLAAAFASALAEARALSAEEGPPLVASPAPRRIRLAERLQEIRDLLLRHGRLAFREALLGGRREREFVVVSFLAVLELLRRAFVRAVQPELFGEIFLEARPEAGPADPAVEDGTSFLDED